MSSAAKSINVVMPAQVYETAARTARKRHISVNALIVESLKATTRPTQGRGLYESFTELGKVAEECDVEYAIHAQQEVIRQTG